MRARHLKVDQGHGVHVGRDVQTAGRIAEELNRVMGIPPDRGVELPVLPAAGVEGPGSDYQLPVGVVVADVLPDPRGQQCKIYLVP